MRAFASPSGGLGFPQSGSASLRSRRYAPSKSPSRIARELGEALGHVPILQLRRLSRICEDHRIFVKLEACNPGGSIKEKNAAFLINEAESSGRLMPGGTIVESSSGNFGIGLAMIGAARGYSVVIVVDAKTPPPMRRLLRAYGAKLIDVPLSEADAEGSMQVARMNRAKALSEEIRGAWYPCQHLNPLNPEAHYDFTAREIDSAFGSSLDAIVVGVSTAGQLAGIGKYIRRVHPKIKLVAVDVAGSAILGTPRHSYKMTGIGLSFIPPNFDASLVDAAYSVSDAVAFSVCRTLALREGLLLGASTGAIAAAALAYAHSFATPQRIVLVNPDRGDRYLETVFDDEWIAAQHVELLCGENLERAYQTLRPVAHELIRSGAGAAS